MNSLRRHYLLSNRHQYCATCDKSFDSALALRIHNEHATYHRDERNEDEDTLAEANLPDLSTRSEENVCYPLRAYVLFNLYHACL
ncbi:zinc-finger-containing protein [Lentinula edodes]|uniref:Zinc-finger-containing protein n=1 Tax=Lentinula edodes TaxID=5353 RepID=A0A1Q3EL65_LENED|nr:zinc-finger-containing protein [Lentinula edodes]